MGYRAYPEYRDSGVEWLGRVPADWEVRRLKFSSYLINEKVDAQESTLDYLGLEHIESWTAKRIADDTSTSEGNASKFSPGDVLFGKLRPYLAKVWLADSYGIATAEALVIRPDSGVAGSFLKYYMLSRDFIDVVNGSTYGSKMPRANWDFIGNSSLLIPGIEEQRQIARFLDHKTAQIDCLIERKKDLIETLQEQNFASTIQAVTKGLDSNATMKDSGIEWLGSVPEHWDVHQLSLLTETIQTGPFGSQLHAADYVDGGIPLINPAHMISGNIVPDEQSAVDTKTVERLSRHKLKLADIIMARRGEIGRCALVKEEQAGWLCGTGSLIIRLAKGNSRFFSIVISSDGFSKKLELHAVGTTMLNINPTIVGRMIVPAPPLPEQNQIVSYIDSATKKIDRSIITARETIIRLQEYRAALITAAVTGQIDVRDWQAPEPTQDLKADKEVA